MTTGRQASAGSPQQRSNVCRSISRTHSSHRIPLVVITPAKAAQKTLAGRPGGAHFLQVPVSKQASLNHEENHPNKVVWQETRLLDHGLEGVPHKTTGRTEQAHP